MDATALRLSLQHGAGDPRWFHKLSREDQIAILAIARVS